MGFTGRMDHYDNCRMLNGEVVLMGIQNLQDLVPTPVVFHTVCNHVYMTGTLGMFREIWTSVSKLREVLDIVNKTVISSLEIIRSLAKCEEQLTLRFVKLDDNFNCCFMPN